MRFSRIVCASNRSGIKTPPFIRGAFLRLIQRLNIECQQIVEHLFPFCNILGLAGVSLRAVGRRARRERLCASPSWRSAPVLLSRATVPVTRVTGRPFPLPVRQVSHSIACQRLPEGSPTPALRALLNKDKGGSRSATIRARTARNRSRKISLLLLSVLTAPCPRCVPSRPLPCRQGVTACAGLSGHRRDQ